MQHGGAQFPQGSRRPFSAMPRASRYVGIAVHCRDAVRRHEPGDSCV